MQHENTWSTDRGKQRGLNNPDKGGKEGEIGKQCTYKDITEGYKELGGVQKLSLRS